MKRPKKKINTCVHIEKKKEKNNINLLKIRLKNNIRFACVQRSLLYTFFFPFSTVFRRELKKHTKNEPPSKEHMLSSLFISSYVCQIHSR